jgi:hypothetical protein
MEIIKQLYDIGYLFDSAEDLSVVTKTFNEYVIVESGYRGINLALVVQSPHLICRKLSAILGRLAID